jgi:surface antigen
MAGPAARHVSRLPRYSGTAVASLRLAVVLGLALAGSGCAVSGPLGSLFAQHKKDDARAAYASEDVTGSIASPRPVAAASTSGLPAETDLVFARMAVTEVLGRNSKGISAPWENPSSGAHGTVTPIASAYNRDGVTCHDFLASYIRQGSEAWLQGEACREKKGKWEVRSLRPWTRS